MITRRRLLWLSLGGLLTGCLPSSQDEKGRTTIRYMAWGNPEQLQLERQIADEFEKLHPKIRVHLFMVPSSSYPDKLQLMLASRTAPDVMRVDHYIFPALVRKDYFLDLEPFIAAEPKGFVEDFVPTALEECRYQGKLHAMNVLFGGVQLYYNKNLFKEANSPDPYDLSKANRWDWDAFLTAANALTKREGDRTVQFGTTFPAFPQWASVLWNRGGDVMDKALTKFTLADDPLAIEGMQDMTDLRWKHHCAPTPADAALSAFTFESGKIAMHWGWAGETPRFRKNIKKFDWDIAPVPTGPAGNTTVIKGNQLVVYQHSKHPELAWEFVKYMTGPEAELILGAQWRRCVPTRLSVQQHPEYLKTDKPPFHTDVFLDTVRRGRTLPIDARYQEWSREFSSATDSLFNVGGITAPQASRNATDKINALLSGEEGF